MPALDIEWYRQRVKDLEPEALIGDTVDRLSRLPRGIDEVLAHLFISPNTVAGLREAMLEDRRSVPDKMFDTVHYIEYAVDHSILYDIGQLAVAGIIETGNGGLLAVPDHLRPGVAVFLRSAYLHPQGPTSNALRSLVIKIVGTR